jgi:hypothetical protein
MPSSPYKISSKSTTRFKSCSHRRSLNVRHFRMVEVTALNSMESRTHSMSSLHRRFQPKLPFGSKIIKGILCNQLRSLNVRHFGMVEATALNSKESRSYSMSSPPYKISSKATNRFKAIKGILCTHFRSLNVRNFGMAKAKRLEMWRRGQL